MSRHKNSKAFRITGDDKEKAGDINSAPKDKQAMRERIKKEFAEFKCCGGKIQKAGTGGEPIRPRFNAGTVGSEL